MRLGAFAVAAIGVQVLAAGAAEAAGEIGDVVDVLTGAYGQPPALDRRPLFPAEAVFADEVVETVPAGGLTVQFHDGSALTLGSDSTVVLDQFVYNPGQGSDAIQLGKGVFRFISGDLDHGDGFQITTPTASIGVRGTDFVVVVLADGGTRVGTISGLVTAFQLAGGAAIDLLPGSYAFIPAGALPMEVSIAPVAVGDAFGLALWLGGDVYVALAGIEPAAGNAPPPAPVDTCFNGTFGCSERPARSNDQPPPAPVQPAAVVPAAVNSPPAGQPSDDGEDPGDGDGGDGDGGDGGDGDGGEGDGGVGEGDGGDGDGGDGGEGDGDGDGDGGGHGGGHGGGGHGGGGHGGGGHGGGGHGGDGHGGGGHG
ncbi:MAG: FecR domain-containing protein, partial [Alphaproteobacteria bacterium]